MAKALIGLGANCGNRSDNLQAAVASLAADTNMNVLATSSWHATIPVGGPVGQSEFLNGATVLETALSPQQLLQALQRIETRLGRQRQIRWDARTLDLDILLYDDFCSSDPELTVPHPRMVFRPFVLLPAFDVAANWVHPVLGWTLSQLVEFMKQTPTRVQLCGFHLLGRNRNLEAVARRAGAEILDDPSAMRLDRFQQQNSEQHLDLFRSRVHRMQSKAWTEPNTAVVSGYCLEETLLFEPQPPAETDTIQKEFDSNRDQTPIPKLNVIWNQTNQQSVTAEFNAVLSNVLRRSNTSPIFELNDDPGVFEDEITAAIQCLNSWAN